MLQKQDMYGRLVCMQHILLLVLKNVLMMILCVCIITLHMTTRKTLVIEPVRNYVETQPAESVVTSTSNPLAKLTAPPEVPGVPRPVWLTILGSVPTALGWYGYYKFSVEEELYQYEMQQEGRVRYDAVHFICKFISVILNLL